MAVSLSGVVRAAVYPGEHSRLTPKFSRGTSAPLLEPTWTRPVAVPTLSLKGALMSPQYRRFVVLAVGLLLLLTPLASAAAVEALFDLASTVTGPFPSDRFTVFDHDNKTGLRMNLPKLNCATRPTDCADADVINTLDGFNLQPRLSIPFSGS